MADIRNAANLDPRLEKEWDDLKYKIQKKSIANLEPIIERFCKMATGKSKITDAKEQKALKAYSILSEWLPISKDIGVDKGTVNEDDINAKIQDLLENRIITE